MSYQQKGLDVQCRKLAKAVDKLAGTLENLLKPTGPKGVTSKDENPARWRLLTPKRCSKKPRRPTMRLLPRPVSF
jgi:hypothetical protein